MIQDWGSHFFLLLLGPNLLISETSIFHMLLLFWDSYIEHIRHGHVVVNVLMDKYITYNLFIKVRFFHLCPA